MYIQEPQVLAYLLGTALAQVGNLHSELNVPVMARTRWMETWASVYEEWQPVTVLVRERATGRVESAALLACQTEGDVAEIVAMGHGSVACTRFPASGSQSSGSGSVRNSSSTLRITSRRSSAVRIPDT